MSEGWEEKVLPRLEEEWIKGVVGSLRELDEEVGRELLSRGGRFCGRSWMEDLGIRPEEHDLDSLISYLNEVRPGEREVMKEGDSVIYRLKLGHCACPLVMKGIVELRPELCRMCGVNFFEEVFGSVVKGPVRAELVESIATGAKECVFRIRLPR